MRNEIKDLAQATDRQLVTVTMELIQRETQRADLQRKLHGKYLSDVQVTAFGTELERAIAAWHDLRAKASALESVHLRYGWTRAWIVPGGHVHRDTGCHTLYAETQIYPVPECSGLSEAEIVELAADRACTVCYPSAPVDKKSTLLAPGEEEVEQRKAERLSKAEEKEAKKVTVVLPDRISGRERPETFGTVRSARTEALSAYDWALMSVSSLDNADAARYYLDTFHRICAAITAHRDGGVSHVDELEADLIKRAGAKFKREVKQPDARTGYKGCSNTEATEKLGKAQAKLDEISAQL